MSDFDDLLSGSINTILNPATSQKVVEEKLPASPVYEAVSALGLLDDVKDMGGNTPFQLNNTSEVWLLLSGSVDIFWVKHNDAPAESVVTGKRHHFTRINQGCIVIGLGSMQAGGMFIGVPANGSKLVSCKLEEFLALGRQKELSTHIANSIDGWCMHILDNMSPKSPRYDMVSLGPGRDIEVSNDAVLYTRDGILWVWDRQKSLALFGQFTCKAYAVPLSPTTWGQLHKPSQVSAVTTTARLVDNEKQITALLFDLSEFNKTALEIFSQELHKLHEEERQRFVNHETAQVSRFSNALSSLGSILVSDKPVAAEAAGQPFLAACQLMAQESGIVLPETMLPEEALLNSPDPIMAFAEYGEFFVRKVVLEGDWWRDMQMPVLGYYGESKQPCVMLPQSRGYCLLVNPANHTSQRITAKVAANIQETGHVFYPPFPQGNMGPGELLRFGIKGMRSSVAPIIFITMLVGLLSMATPVVTSWILEPIIPEAQMEQLIVMIGALILVGVSMGAFSFVQSIALMRMEGLVTHRVQAAVWDKLLKLPISFFKKFSVGDLANRAQGIDSMRQLLSNSLMSSFVHGVTGLFSFCMMLYYNWKISLFILLVAFAFIVINFFVGKKILSYSADVLEQTGRLRGIVFQLLSSVQKIRITGSERSAFVHWAAVYRDLQEMTLSQRKLNSALGIIRTIFSFLALITLLVVLSLEGGSIFDFYFIHSSDSINGHKKIMSIMPMAHFVAFHVAFGQFMSAVFGLSNMVIQLLNFKPLYNRVKPIMEAEQETVSHHEYLGEVAGDIEVCDVKFRYSKEADLILNKTSFYAKPGEYIALTGPSGAGKSTLIRMLLGFESPEAGSIFIDGKDIGQLDKRSMRRHFGVVLQNGRLLSGSIFHNITAGANLSHDDAWAAAKKAGLDKDIELMPMGMETYLGESASSLSGGQRQRLMIARAIIHKPQIIIFDEATSALDNEVQSIVMKSLDELSNTRIVVAHRLSTIINADRIYVMDKGQIVESGSYQELMDMHGLFHEMAIRQIA
ncbi:MAG: NHLP bacteriocin export ABC transporter permease/ATPase subunit [Gammaproteobacteria bacterium]|nr:NHLP bacteriocin export ABC transporter permease/ATPase subunit [Gammaproteobacteria bacterium]